MSQTSHFLPKTRMGSQKLGEAFRFKIPSSILVVGLTGCSKTCFTYFTESIPLDHLEELSQFVFSEGWITRVRRSEGGGRSRQRVVGFIHQTFSSSKYHRVVIVRRYVSTREIH